MYKSSVSVLFGDSLRIKGERGLEGGVLGIFPVTKGGLYYAAMHRGVRQVNNDSIGVKVHVVR